MVFLYFYREIRWFWDCAGGMPFWGSARYTSSSTKSRGLNSNKKKVPMHQYFHPNPKPPSHNPTSIHLNPIPVLKSFKNSKSMSILQPGAAFSKNSTLPGSRGTQSWLFT